jgi:integrase
MIRKLAENADLENPHEVNEYIYNLPVSDSYKIQFTHVYAQYMKFRGKPYERPKYKQATPRAIRIPTEEKINMIIAESGKTLSTKLTLSKETGLRPVEVHDLKVKDIDLEQRLVYPTTAKNGASRILKISPNLASMLQAHITRYKLSINDNVFRGSEDHYTDEYIKVRNRLAKKLQDDTIRTIRLYDLRHFYATMLYHKTKDILLVKQKLGHKTLKPTLVYIDLESTLYNTKDDYTHVVARNLDEACKAIDTGFEYVTDMDGFKLFRKRK